MDFENVDAVGEPLGHDFTHVLGRLGGGALEQGLVEVRRARVHLVLRQDVGLAAEPADALDAANEARPVLRLDAVEFRLGRAVLEQLVQLFADGGLHLLEVAAGLGGGYDVKLPADLVRKDVRRDARRDLVLVDEALE